MDIMQTFFIIKPDGTYVGTRLRGVARMGCVAQPPRAAESKEGQNQYFK